MAYSDEQWAECKRKCRLNEEDIALAKRLGLNPRSLIKNIPNKNEPRKAPVKDWLREMESKRNKNPRKSKNAKSKKAGKSGTFSRPAPKRNLFLQTRFTAHR